MRPFTVAVILIAVLAGTCAMLGASHYPQGSILNTLFLGAGSGLVSTGFISLVLDLFWSKVRADEEEKRISAVLERVNNFAEQLQKLEGRLEAFKQLGLNYCHANRRHALEKFLVYAEEIVSVSAPIADKVSSTTSAPQSTVNIVSSSARGLMGYLDREPNELYKQWRELLIAHPTSFRILLTHPAYAHLRQPSEERNSGEIELEVIKTAMFLHLVAGMNESELRFYRGSPTVFAIQANKHILLNPYPYGKMAMDTLCFEFESAHESSYVAGFMDMHFNQAWAFFDQPSKRVDGKPLVEGVSAFKNILDAFAECTYLGEGNRLRLRKYQVTELDQFTRTIAQRWKTRNDMPSGDPFMECVRTNQLKCADDEAQAPRSAAARV